MRNLESGGGGLILNLPYCWNYSFSLTLSSLEYIEAKEEKVVFEAAIELSALVVSLS